jgi:hypothetical protein
MIELSPHALACVPITAIHLIGVGYYITKRDGPGVFAALISSAYMVFIACLA